jgi:diguanylate cyclase (GGDEF)-like protein/PAS domain S-box-containing protein
MEMARVVAKSLVTGAVLALLCWVSIRYTREPGGTSTLWLASGVLTGILLTSPRREWPWLVVSAFAANMIVRTAIGDPWSSAAILATATLIESVPVAAILVWRIGDVTDPQRIGKTARIAFASTFICCAVSAFIAAFDLVATRAMTFAWAYITWFTVHTLGMVTFATLTTVVRSLGWRLIGKSGRRVEFLATLVLLGTVCYVVFSLPYPLLFLIYPPLLLCTFRHRIAGAALATALVSAFAIAATLAGHGPFHLIPKGHPTQRVLLLQVFITSVCLVTFPVLTVLTQRRLFARSLRENQRRLTAITDNLPAFVMHVGPDGRYTYANAYVSKVLGADPQSYVGRTVEEVTGEVYGQVKPHAEAAMRGETVTYELERDIDGKHYHLQQMYIPDRDDVGKVRGYYLLSFDITHLKEIEQALSSLARHDSLTGLANRRQFEEAMDMALARQRRTGRPLVLIYMDVDHFKSINDGLGHAIGDEVLKAFAQRIKQAMYETDLVARLGGDEFVILIENVDSPETLPLLGRKLQAAIEPAISTDRGDLRITSSIGIAHCSKGDYGREDLLAVADRALYAAKAAGRNTWHIVRQ